MVIEVRFTRLDVPEHGNTEAALKIARTGIFLLQGLAKLDTDAS